MDDKAKLQADIKAALENSPEVVVGGAGMTSTRFTTVGMRK
jgi:hypothetical protein